MSFDLLVLAGFVYLFGLIWAVLDIVRSDFKDGATKIVFVLIVLLLPAIGVAIYMFHKRKWIILSAFLALMIGLIATSMYITANNYNKMLSDTNEVPLKKTSADDFDVGPLFAMDKIMATTKEGSNIGFSVAIELSNKEKAQIFLKEKQKIEQMVATMANTKTVDEIKRGIYKKELFEKLNTMYPDAVKNVYIVVKPTK